MKGEVRVRSHTADPRAVGVYGGLVDETGADPLTLTAVRLVKGRVVARVAGVTDRDAARSLAGRALCVPRAALPEPDEDEFYNVDLIGLSAAWIDDRDRPIGTVVAVDDFGAGPMLDITRDDGTSVVIPFTRAAVPEVDLATGRVLVAPVPGLLEPDTANGSDGSNDGGEEDGR